MFADNDAAWDHAAQGLLARVINNLSLIGAPRLVSLPLRDEPPWYKRVLQSSRELPRLEQALWPMQEDSLPWFHARFGDGGTALRTGGGHFLLWITLPDSGPEPEQFARKVAQPSDIFETRLRWAPLLPG